MLLNVNALTLALYIIVSFYLFLIPNHKVKSDKNNYILCIDKESNNYKSVCIFRSKDKLD